MTKKTTILTAAALGAGIAIAPMAASAATIMKIGFATINDGQHKSAKWIAKEVMKRTNGSIDVKVYPAAQLGKIPRMIEGVLLGTIEGFISPPGFFKGLNPAFAAPDAPGLFNSFAHQTKTMNHPSVRSKFLNLGTPKGVTGLYISAAGASALAMRDPVRKLADVKGKKIRVLVTSSDVLHAFAMPALGSKIDAVPGRTNETWFLIDEPGMYYGQCSELCGAGHAFMPLAIKAVPEAEFNAWVTKAQARFGGADGDLAPRPIQITRNEAGDAPVTAQ